MSRPSARKSADHHIISSLLLMIGVLCWVATPTYPVPFARMGNAKMQTTQDSSRRNHETGKVHDVKTARPLLSAEVVFRATNVKGRIPPLLIPNASTDRYNGHTNATRCRTSRFSSSQSRPPGYLHPFCIQCAWPYKCSNATHLHGIAHDSRLRDS